MKEEAAERPLARGITARNRFARIFSWSSLHFIASKPLFKALSEEKSTLEEVSFTESTTHSLLDLRASKELRVIGVGSLGVPTWTWPPYPQTNITLVFLNPSDKSFVDFDSAESLTSSEAPFPMTSQLMRR